jgi:DNA invertase Pin-like site-specific DNA recombinase
VPTARRQSAQIIALAQTGKTKQAIADELKINIRSVFRVLAENAKPAHRAAR